MKIAILNSDELSGGAAIATNRVHVALRRNGVDSKLIVQNKVSSDPTVLSVKNKYFKLFHKSLIDNLPLSIYRKRVPSIFSSALAPDSIGKMIASVNPEIVQLFWVNDGFLRLENLKNINKPIVWTLHDMWPMTGGCHYAGDCIGYQSSCGKCPALRSPISWDLSRLNLLRKIKTFKGLHLTIVVGNKWLESCVKASSVFQGCRVEVIQNCLNLDKYRPLDKAFSRVSLGLPLDRKLILFSAHGAFSDGRKGGHLLVDALRAAVAKGFNHEVELLVLGAQEGPQFFGNNVNVRYLGNLNDEISQILLYSAADILAAPSLHENLSNTVIEGMASGLPAIAFNVGGMPDIITDGYDGFVITKFDTDQYADALVKLVNDSSLTNLMSHRARQSILKRNDVDLIACQYRNLYESILKAS